MKHASKGPPAPLIDAPADRPDFRRTARARRRLNQSVKLQLMSCIPQSLGVQRQPVHLALNALFRSTFSARPRSSLRPTTEHSSTDSMDSLPAGSDNIHPTMGEEQSSASAFATDRSSEVSGFLFSSPGFPRSSIESTSNTSRTNSPFLFLPSISSMISIDHESPNPNPLRACDVLDLEDTHSESAVNLLPDLIDRQSANEHKPADLVSSDSIPAQRYQTLSTATQSLPVRIREPQLPDEILYRICIHADPSSRKAMRLTCRKWKVLVDSIEPPTTPNVFALPIEVIRQLLLLLGLIDFGAARKTCGKLRTAGMEPSTLAMQIRRAGW